MDRVLKGSASTIGATFFVDEQPLDSTVDVTIEVVRDNGDVLVPAGTATQAGAAADGRYEFTLLPAHSGRVDRLTALWTATLNGYVMTLETQVEVVGAFYFTLAAARASDTALASTSKYTTPQLAEARAEVEDECEAITKVAWVERYRRFQFSGRVRRHLVLPDVRIREVFSLSIDGVAYGEDELADLRGFGANGWGLLTRKTGGLFGSCDVDVDIAYSHGYDQPTSDIRRAALIRIQNRLFAENSGIPDRATSFSSGDGGTFSLTTAGKGGSETGVPDVDAVYRRHIHDRPVFA